MALVKIDFEKANEMLQKIIYSVEEKPIEIHETINGITVRNTAVLENANIGRGGVYFECGWFWHEIKRKVTEITYSEDDGLGNQSMFISFQDGELALIF